MAASEGAVPVAVLAAIGLGARTALVYPTLIAAISDTVSPRARAPAIGVYRFWRDIGYVVGGLTVGLVADALDFTAAIVTVAALTTVSGLWAAVGFRTRPAPNLVARYPSAAQRESS